MAKQDKQYTIVPVERVTQLMTMGVGYEGHVKLPNIEEELLLTVDFVSLGELSNAKYKRDLVYLTALDGGMMVLNAQDYVQKYEEIDYSHINNASRDILEPSSVASSIIEIGADVTGELASKSKLTVGFMKKKPKLYQKWGGNRYVRTYKVSVLGKGAKLIGPALFFIEIPFELISVIKGEQSPVKAVANIVFSAVGTFGGPVGLLIFGLYSTGAFSVPDHGGTPKIRSILDTNPADKTRVELSPKLENFQRQPEPKYAPREPPVLKQGYKKWR